MGLSSIFRLFWWMGGSTAQAQAAAVQSVSAVLKFAGSTPESQAAAQEALNALLKFTSATGEAQASQVEVIAALLKFVGTIAEIQAAQTESAISKLVFRNTAVENAANETEAAAGKLVFGNTAAEVQQAQAENTAGKLVFSNTTAENAAHEAEAIAGKLVFSATNTELAAIQAEASAAKELFNATAAQIQAAGTETLAAILKFLNAASELASGSAESGVAINGTLPTFTASVIEVQAAAQSAGTAIAPSPSPFISTTISLGSMFGSWSYWKRKQYELLERAQQRVQQRPLIIKGRAKGVQRPPTAAVVVTYTAPAIVMSARCVQARPAAVSSSKLTFSCVTQQTQYRPFGISRGVMHDIDLEVFTMLLMEEELVAQ